jgi:cell division protein FtsI/penicillin-binding protein 2
VLIVAGFGILGAQLFRDTVLPNGRYLSYATNEGLTTTVLPGLRGAIVDRYGRALALTETLKSVTADPVLVTNPNLEAARLAGALSIPVAQIHAQLISATQFVYIKRLIPQSEATQVQRLISASELPGVTLINEQTRAYPQSPLAQSVIGQTNTFGQGISGLEYQYNKVLAGHNGSETYAVSLNGIKIPNGVQSFHPPRNGSTLQLSLDSTLQYEAERELAGEMVTSRAIGGTVVVMDVQTGEILAMVSLSANPPPGQVNTPAGFPSGAIPVDSQRALPAESWSNTAVSSVYEPGSVAKIATFTAALEHHVITTKSSFVIPSQLLIDGSVFHDAEPHPTETLTVGQILGQSSNIGTIEIAEKLGKVVLTKSFERYGWGEPTGLNFPGESRGYLRPISQWSGTAIGSVPIGQDEAVTPLQVLNSYNAIANNGVMVTPRLVLGIKHPSGRVTHVSAPKPHRIETVTIAKEMQGLLENAVSPLGTAPSAVIPGYVVAGKTGTSQKPWPAQSGYQPGAFWGTFVGFAPASHPVLSALVMLDQPTPIYGGSVAAPVFANVMSYALHRYGVTPTGAILGNLLPTVKETQIAARTARRQPKVTSPSRVGWHQVRR